MSSETDYRDVVQAIVEKELESVGSLALKRASRVEGLDEGDEELIFRKEPDRETVEELLDVYSEFQGKGSIGIARQAVADELNPDFSIDLPAKIIPPKLNKERFVKGF